MMLQPPSALMKGAGKFQTPARRSFLVGMQTGVIVNELLRLKHFELAKFVAICYTYQLRAQSEGFPIQSGVRQLDVAGDHWHSDVVVTPKTVAIVLRRRKTTTSPPRSSGTAFARCGYRKDLYSAAPASSANWLASGQADATGCSRASVRRTLRSSKRSHLTRA